MMKKEYKPAIIQYDEIPLNVRGQIESELGYYSLAMLGLRQSGLPDEEIALAASGTLIEIQGNYYVLTAGHVIEAINRKECDSIGFNISKDTHSLRIDRNSLILKNVWEESRPDQGPDLGLVSLPIEHVGWFQAKKNFWNIELKRTQAVSREYRDLCFWALCGAPFERSSWAMHKRNYKAILSQHMGPWLANKIEESSSHGYDYIDVIFDAKPSEEWPSDFGGLSGGGLWQLVLEKKLSSGKISFKIALLVGMPFYQFIESSARSRIRCHGINSVYDKVQELL